jgi:hypothetical protein
MLFKHIVFFHHCFFTDFDHPKLWFVGAFEFITFVTTCLTPIISYNHGFYNANLCFDGSKNRWPPWILPLNHWGQRIKVRSSPMNHLCPKRRISLYHVAFSTMIPFSSNYIILRTMSLYIYIYLYIYITPGKTPLSVPPPAACRARALPPTPRPSAVAAAVKAAVRRERSQAFCGAWRWPRGGMVESWWRIPGW